MLDESFCGGGEMGGRIPGQGDSRSQFSALNGLKDEGGVMIQGTGGLRNNADTESALSQEQGGPRVLTVAQNTGRDMGMGKQIRQNGLPPAIDQQGKTGKLF